MAQWEDHAALQPLRECGHEPTEEVLQAAKGKLHGWIHFSRVISDPLEIASLCDPQATGSVVYEIDVIAPFKQPIPCHPPSGAISLFNVKADALNGGCCI